MDWRQPENQAVELPLRYQAAFVRRVTSRAAGLTMIRSRPPRLFGDRLELLRMERTQVEPSAAALQGADAGIDADIPTRDRACPAR